MSEEQKTEPQNQIVAVETTNAVSAFSSINAFEQGQRMASLLAKSDLVPQSYKGNVANCLLALEVANRTGSSIMAVVQNLNIVHGRPSWSSSYIIAAVNGCGRFTPLQFKVWVEGKEKHCLAYCHSKVTGELVEGPEVSTTMAKSEGWEGRNGSKWKTMPDLMLRYRAAAFFGRLYAPDVLMGMQTVDEVEDFASPVEPSVGAKKTSELNERIRAKKGEAEPSSRKVIEGEVVAPERKTEESSITSPLPASSSKKPDTKVPPSTAQVEVETQPNEQQNEGFY